MLEPPDRLVLALVRVLWRSATDLSRAIIRSSLSLLFKSSSVSPNLSGGLLTLPDLVTVGP